MKNLLKRLVREEQGQDVIEYALLAAAISTVCIPVIPLIGAQLLVEYGEINTEVAALP